MGKKMFIILLCLAVLLGLVGCSNKETATNSFGSIEVLETSPIYGKILVDRDTGVLYLWYRDDNQYAQLTPLYKADGSLKTIVDFEQ